MSTFIRIFCQSTKSVTRREIADFIKQAAFFDDAPRFEPVLDSPELDAESWKLFTVHYQDCKRPIQFERNVNDKLLQEEIEEILEEYEQSNIPHNIVHKLKASYQVIAADVDPVGLTEDAWNMLDALEHYLAQNPDGIVYDEYCFYDKDLKLICELRKR